VTRQTSPAGSNSVGTAYRYQVVDRAGRRLRGQEAASSPDALAQALTARGLLVVRVEQTNTAQPQRSISISGSRSRGGLETARALAALLGAGLPVARALAAAEAMVAPSLVPTLRDARERVERGEALAAALAAQSGLFPAVGIGLIRAGERSGNLAPAFGRLAGQLERQDALRSRLLSISIYPLLLATGGGVAVLVLLFVVLPRFAELLQGTGMTLPRSTLFVLGVADLLNHAWPALLGLAAALVALIAWTAASPAGRRVQAQLLLATPGIAHVRRELLAARFARLLAVLAGGGAPLLGALEGTAESLNDPLAREEADRVRTRVREGATLHRGLEESTIFPPMLARLVALGEETGRLPEFLGKAADLLEERTERLLQRLVSLAEPAMIIVFGGIVGFVALSLLQAVYSINTGSFR
jgi:type II secretory pathway component PulF